MNNFRSRGQSRLGLWIRRRKETIINVCIVVSASLSVIFLIIFFQLVFGSQTPSAQPPPDPQVVISELRGRKPTIHGTLDAVEFSEQLGRATWFLLHSIADTYPDNPTTGEKHKVISLLRNLEYFYPCEESRQTWRNVKSLSNLQEIQLAVTTRTHLKQWMCTFHNLVNVWLSKPQFDCTPANLEIRVAHQDSSHRKQRENDFAESVGSELTAFEEVTHALTGPCQIPLAPTLFLVQSDPYPEGFSILSKRFGPARYTVLYFLTRECSLCMTTLQHLSNIRPKVLDRLNIVGIFEWSSVRPSRDERSLLASEIAEVAPNLPILFEGFSGKDSLLDYYFPLPQGVPYAAILDGCQIDLTFYPSQSENLMETLTRIVGDVQLIYENQPKKTWGSYV